MQRRPGSTPRRGAAGRPRSRPCRAGRCPAARPRAGGARPPRGRPRAVVGDPDLVPERASSSLAEAAGRCPRCRRRPGPGGADAPRRPRSAPSARRPARRRPPARGQPDDELAPRPGPLARGRDAARRAARPASAPASGRCPARPGAVERAVAWANSSKIAGQQLGRDADARVAGPGRRPRPPRGSAGERDPAPAASVYLAALFSRLTRTCSSRVGSASSRERPPSASETVSVVPPLLDQRPDGLDGPVRRSARGRAAPCGARSCPG